MICEVRTFKLFIPQSNSLKTKRRVIKSIVERIKNRFNISVIERSGNDVWQRADICIALLSNKQDLANQELMKIEKFIELSGEVLITEVEKNPI
jgi:uncharacterized protein YlxP (DUF503 family)